MPDKDLTGLLDAPPAQIPLTEDFDIVSAPREPIYNRDLDGLLGMPAPEEDIEAVAKDRLRLADEHQAPLWLVEDYYSLIKQDEKEISDPSGMPPPTFKTPETADEFGALQNKKITLGEQIRRMDAADWPSILDPFRSKELIETGSIYYAVQRLREDKYDKFTEEAKKWAQTPGPLGEPLADLSGLILEQYKQRDVELIESWLLKREEEQVRGFTFGAQVFKGATYLPGWMLAFMLTGGLNKLGSDSAKRAGVKLLGDYATTQAGQVALKTMGWAGGAITQVSLGMPTLVLDETLQRRLPKQMRFGPNNELIVEMDGDSWATAILKGWGTIVIETASESAGKGIGQTSRALVGKLPFGNRLLAEFAKIIPAGKLDELFTLAGWNGFLQEIGEERLATILHAVAGTQDFGKADGDMWDRLQAGITQDIQNLPVELTVLALPGAVKYAAAKGMAAPLMPTDAEKADIKLDSQSTRAAESIRRAFDQPREGDVDLQKLDQDAETNSDFIKDLMHNTGIKSRDGYEPLSKKDYHDIFKFFQFPQDVARSFPEFEPLYKVLGQARQQTAFTFMHAFNEGAKPYFELSKQEMGHVDKALLESEQNPDVTYGPKQLKKMGLSDSERTAFLAIRTNLDKAKWSLYNLMKDLGVPENKLAEFEKQIKNYVPHRWYGEWSVVVKERIIEKEKPPTKARAITEAEAFLKGEEAPPMPTVEKELAKPKTVFMSAVNFGERFKERDRLLKQYPAPNYEVMVIKRNKIPYEAFQQAPAWAVQRMVDLAMEKAQIHQDTAGKIKEALGDLYKAKGFGLHFIKRTGVPGYTENLARPLAEYFNGFAWYYAKIQAMHQLPKALGQVSASKTPQLYRYSLDYTKYMLGDTPEFQNAKKFAYSYYLLGRLSSAAINATQNFVVGWPVLAKNTNFALPKLLQAMARTAAPKGVFLSTAEKSMLAEMEKRGYLEMTLTQEISAYTLNPVLRSVRGGIERAMSAVDVFRMMEQFNRRSMAVALFDAGITNIDEIHKLVNEAHWEYGKHNRPVLYRGYMSPIMTFRSWYLHYLTWTKNEIKAGKIAPIARSYLALMFWGGLRGLPIFLPLAYIWRKVFDRDLETDIRKSTGDWGRMVSRGVPTTIGIDFSETLGPGDIYPSDISVKELVGVFGDIAERGRLGYEALQNNDYQRLAEIASPQAFRSPLAAYRMYNEGAYTMSGRPVLDLTTGEQLKLTGKEASIKALGFQPVRLAEQRHVANYLEAAQAARQDKKQHWANRMQLAALENDRQAIIEVIKEIQEFNNRMIRRGRKDETIESEEMIDMLTVRGLPANIPPQYMWPLLKDIAEGYGVKSEK